MAAYLITMHVNTNTFPSVKNQTVNGDYVGTTQAVTFTPGTAQQTVQVPIIDDSVFESTEQFSAQLTTTDRRVNIVEPSASATIRDDDTGMFTVSLSE